MTTTLEKLSAANAALTSARHRAAELERAIATHTTGIHCAHGRLRQLEARNARGNDIAEANADMTSHRQGLAEAKAELEQLNGSMRGLVESQKLLAQGEQASMMHRINSDLDSVCAAWTETIRPHLALAQRLRDAARAAGRYCLIPDDADLLAGIGKRKIV